MLIFLKSKLTGWIAFLLRADVFLYLYKARCFSDQISFELQSSNLSVFDQEFSQFKLAIRKQQSS